MVRLSQDNNYQECGEGRSRGTITTYERKRSGSSPGTFHRLCRFQLPTFHFFHQLHWQDYSDPAYIDALEHLRALQSEGLIKTIGLCNFDSIRSDEICTVLGPGAIVSNQVQVGFRDQHGIPEYFYQFQFAFASFL